MDTLTDLQITQVPAQLFPVNTAVLAIDLAEVIGQGTRRALEDFVFGLQKQLRQARPRLDPSVMLALQEGSNGKDAALSTLDQAYQLGALSFALLLASNELNVRADDDFTDRLRDRKYSPYVQMLLRGECSNYELRQAADEREETVCRKLADLRLLGAVDFRRDGMDVFNFLTPLGRVVASTIFPGDAPATGDENASAPERPCR